jgi:DNA repair protein RecO (recombination protein O)
MNILTSAAIIMRVREFGESDLLVTFFTPERGKMKGVAKGARRSKSRFVNCLDIFSLVNLEYSIKRNSSLHFIHSGKLIDAFPGLRKNYRILIQASYMIELIDILFPWELADSVMFETLKDTFKILAEGGDIETVSVLFEIAAMALGGFSINLEKCCICGRVYTGRGKAVFKPDRGGIACMNCQQITGITPGMSPETVKITGNMQCGFSMELENLKISKEFITEIKKVLKLHREYHLERIPKSSNYLE